MIRKLKRFARRIVGIDHLKKEFEDQKMLSGAILTNQLHQRGPLTCISKAEFSVFSQWGDDGIIQYLLQQVNIPNKTFIEFGVENYQESNTRFLLMNNNWSGLVLDGSRANILEIENSHYYWKHDLVAVECFVDMENINGAISNHGFRRDVGLLHIDIDGNVFGPDRAITVPYKKDFNRTQAHHSNLYFGASLAALVGLSEQKGYQFVGCNSAGNNAYFVRSDKINDAVMGISVKQGFQESKYRESRNARGQLDFKRGTERLQALSGLPVINVETNQLEEL